MIDSLNIGALAETYRLLKTLDIQAWNISPPQATGNWRHAKTAASLEMQAQAFAPLLEAWVKDGRPFMIRLGGFYCHFDPQMLRMPSPEMPVGQGSGNGANRRRARRGIADSKAAADMPQRETLTPDSYDCGSCREQPCLLPDGTLVPCPGYVDSIFQDRMPNLLREDLSKVWRRSFLREIADIRKKDVLARNPECASCELLFKECAGGCRATALTETGDLLAREPMICELLKKGYKKRFQEIAASAL